MIWFVEEIRFMRIAACSQSCRLAQVVEFSVAVGELVERNADLVEQREMQIRERRRVLVANVTPTFHSPRRPPRNNDRQVRVIMKVGVAHAAAIKEE